MGGEEMATSSLHLTMEYRDKPSGFVLTTLLGIAGAFVATYLGQAIGWYRPMREPGSSEPSWAR